MAIYLDYNATTPVHTEVLEAMTPYFGEVFGNPSSTHGFGTLARMAVERARGRVAEFLGCEPDEIIFTSGGSESNNLAIKGVVAARHARSVHIVTSEVEHPAVLEVCLHLEGLGHRVTRVGVDADGVVKPEDVLRACGSETVLVTIMHANNEVGAIQPVEEIALRLRGSGILLHTDAAQSAGKIPVRVNDLGVDLLSLAGHKLYAPKGVGALYIRRGVRLERQIHGAAHEQNLRAGTENVPFIVGLGMACEIAGRQPAEVSAHLRETRDMLEAGIIDMDADIRIHAQVANRLPNTLSVGFAGIEAETLLSELTEIAASPGAACHAETTSISHVLVAMRVPIEYARGTVRFSTGVRTTGEDIQHALRMIRDALSRLHASNQPANGSVPDSTEVKLTQFTHGLGCACKLRPMMLENILSSLPRVRHPDVLVGAETSDDAAVYRIDENTAIVHSVDFFTPVVDDPYDFGAIAAANALSDIYAMGAKPLFALNIVGFPSERLPAEILLSILRGASDKAAEAGVVILGGHTIDDVEPKFGMAVVGRVHPDRIRTNCSAQEYDTLVLTKAIGTGVLSTALKRGLLSKETVAKLVSSMSALNRDAADIMDRHTVHACTDVTGFGLLGHLLEMTRGSGVDAELSASAVCLLPGVLGFIGAGIVPGGTVNNLAHCEPWIQWADDVAPVLRTALADAQTSGGLLMAVPAGEAAAILAELHLAGMNDASIIGRCLKRGVGRVRVLP